MLNWLKSLFKPKSLNDALNLTKKVKIKGVLFTIRKIDVRAHMAGMKVMLQIYDTYRLKGNQKAIETVTPKQYKKIQDTYRDTFLSAVVKPELTKENPPGEKVFVDDIFHDWDMAEELYMEILAHTYGKKKFKLKNLTEKNY